MAVINLSKETFVEKVYDYLSTPSNPAFKGSRPAVIDFFATWCGPCKMMSPIFDELSDEYSDRVDFYKIDVDKEEEISSLFNVRSIPTFVFIPLNGMPQLSTGAISKSDFVKLINNSLT